ncbi:MAG: hypothetical protein ACJ8FY_06590 [Gemmataceae bacterium]
MRRLVTPWLAVCVVVSAVSFARADAQADMKTLIEKGVKSLGGQDKLTKLQATVVKVKGKFYGFGDGLDYTAETSTMGMDKIRNLIEGNMDGNKFSFTQIYNNGKGWMAMGGDAQDLPEDQLDEIKQSLYTSYIMRLYMLPTKEYTLKSLGDSKAGDTEVYGIKVSRKGYKDVTLFLDKKTGLVVKSESTVKNTMGGGEEQKEERMFADYKDHDGIKYPTKATITRDGKKFVESEATDVKFSEKLDDNTFAKPGT